MDGQAAGPGSSLNTVRLAAILLAAGVGLGAFGAHGLRAVVAAERLVTWQTAVDYHLLHALGLLALGLAGERLRPGARRWAVGLLVTGIGLFCGSLYLLVLTEQRWLGAVTPLGGAVFIAGWLTVAAGAAVDASNTRPQNRPDEVVP